MSAPVFVRNPILGAELPATGTATTVAVAVAAASPPVAAGAGAADAPAAAHPPLARSSPAGGSSRRALPVGDASEFDAFARDLRAALLPAAVLDPAEATHSDEQLRKIAAYVLVLPWGEATHRVEVARLLERMYVARLRFRSYQAADGASLFVEVFADMERLVEEADHRDILLPLDPFYLRLLDLRTNVLEILALKGDHSPGSELRERKERVVALLRPLLARMRQRHPEIRANDGPRAEDLRRFEAAIGANRVDYRTSLTRGERGLCAATSNLFAGPPGDSIESLGLVVPPLDDAFCTPQWDSYAFVYAELRETYEAMTPESRGLLRSLYRVHPRTQSILGPTDCLKLLRIILEAPRSDDPPGVGLDLDNMLHRGTLIACYPLHAHEERDRLAEVWGLAFDDLLAPKTTRRPADSEGDAGAAAPSSAAASVSTPPPPSLAEVSRCTALCTCARWPCCRYRRRGPRPCRAPWFTPADDIRAYFGEKVGFYFAFLSFFTAFLTVPAFIGTIVFIVQLEERTPNLDATSVFGIIMALWSALFLEFWKRKQSTIACKWGTSSFRLNEVHRPAFVVSAEVTQRPSPVTGKIAFHRNPLTALSKLSISASVITTVLGSLIAVIVGLFFLRVELIDLWPDYGAYAFGVLNALQIQVLSFVYPWLARLLTNYENQPTQTAYENSLIVKTVVFQIINSYFSLFYIAFVKGNGDDASGAAVSVEGTYDQCTPTKDGVPDDSGTPDCMFELQSQLGSLLVSRLVVQNLLEAEAFLNLKRFIVEPIKSCVQTRLCCRPPPKERAPGEVSQAEKEFNEEVYDTYEDYLEQIILYGYATLFVTAFPLAPLLVFLNNLLEIVLDSWKVLHETRRPPPQGAQDIGSWGFFLHGMSTAAMITNLALVIFTAKGEFFGANEFREKVLLFIVLEHALLFGRWVIDLAIPDLPYRVDIQLQRQDYLVRKHVDGVPDEYENRKMNSGHEKSWTEFLCPCCNRSRVARQVEFGKATPTRRCCDRGACCNSGAGDEGPGWCGRGRGCCGSARAEKEGVVGVDGETAATRLTELQAELVRRVHDTPDGAVVVVPGMVGPVETTSRPNHRSSVARRLSAAPRPR